MLMRLVTQESVKIVSFDVFDTVLTRVTAEPRGIFMMMSRSLSQSDSGLDPALVAGFCERRMAAERAARKKCPGEVTLREIYAELALAEGLEPGEAERLAGVEVGHEAVSVVALPRMKKVVEECRALGKKVVFASDMYLPQWAVRQLLERLGIFAEGDALYLSSEHRATKRDGGLFRVMLQQEKCLPSHLLHIGDNWASDAKSPRALGIAAHHVTDTCLTPSEKILLGEGDLAGQYLAGAARIARLQGDSLAPDRHAELYRLGASVAGPLFAAFLHWMLPLVRSSGVRRLYFLARDGQILLELARMLFRDEGIELRYLFASRQAWHLPALTEITERELSWITLANPYLTLRVLAGRLQLDTALLQAVLAAGGVAKEPDEPFGRDDTARLKGLLAEPGELATLVKARAAELRQDALGYLRQEGLFDEVPWALVDLGWFGNMQDSLQKMLEMGGCRTAARGFYLGLLREPASGEFKHPFLFSPGSSAWMLEAGKSAVQLAELFASGDHGATLCYRRGEDGYLPVLKPRPDWIDGWGLAHLRSGCFAFAANLDPGWWREDLDLRHLLLKLLQRLQRSPTRGEAEALGDYRFSSDQGETVLRGFAPSVTFAGALSYIASVHSDERFKITFWLHGSRARSALPVRVFLSACSWGLILFNKAMRQLGLQKD